MHREVCNARTRSRRRRGAVVVEYLLLVTLVGIGAVVGLATVRMALVEELTDLAQAIAAINDNGTTTVTSATTCLQPTPEGQPLEPGP